MRLLLPAMFMAIAFAVTISNARTLSFPPQQSGVVQFATPLGNIGCTYIPFDGAGGIDTGVNGPELHCYRMSGRFEAVSLGPNGAARELVVRGKLDCCKGQNALAFGSTLLDGGYECTSTKATLECRRGGHGFSISSESITRY
jgi:hypothetical protein